MIEEKLIDSLGINILNMAWYMDIDTYLNIGNNLVKNCCMGKNYYNLNKDILLKMGTSLIKNHNLSLIN